METTTTAEDGLTQKDSERLTALTKLLGLWFHCPSWEPLRTDEDSPYVHIRDVLGDIRFFLAQDETGEYGIENTGDYEAPDLSAETLGDLALKVMAHFAETWAGVGMIARQMVSEAI